MIKIITDRDRWSMPFSSSCTCMQLVCHVIYPFGLSHYNNCCTNVEHQPTCWVSSTGFEDDCKYDQHQSDLQIHHDGPSRVLYVWTEGQPELDPKETLGSIRYKTVPSTVYNSLLIMIRRAAF